LYSRFCIQGTRPNVGNSINRIMAGYAKETFAPGNIKDIQHLTRNILLKDDYFALKPSNVIGCNFKDLDNIILGARCKVILDAEESFVNPHMEMLAKRYNLGQTFQMYLKDSPSKLRDLVSKGNKNPIKLVRGAYLGTERLGVN